VEILRQPEAYQQTIRDLDSIIERYHDFAGATDDVAKAHEFLTRSVQQYVAQQERQLSSAERDAIENAVKLNDLLEQRSRIISESASREYDVRTAGVLSRQRTVAQTKMAEIEAVRKERDEQLAAINKQIELTQFRMDAENQMFNLSMTRVDLETRLMVLQKENILMDIQRISALQSVVTALKSGAPLNLKDVTEALQKAGGLSQSFETLYSSFGRMGYAGFNGEF